MNVLLTSVGRRVELVRFFKIALSQEAGKVYAADVDRTAPGLYEADRGFLVPGVTDSNYIDELLNLCKREKINLVIPLIDPELPVLARVRDMFYRYGIRLLVSSPEVIDTGSDKLKTFEFFAGYEIPTPNTISVSEYLGGNKRISFPLIIKPRFGSAGKDVIICHNEEDIAFFSKRIPEPIIQEYLKGEEVTIDILCDFENAVISVVPRQRLKVRGGEVERALTRREDLLLDWGKRIAECLKPEGPINIQCFLTEKGPVFTEINPRFGGGYPLSYYAGADFPSMIIRMMKGEKVAPCIGDFRDRFVMMRYDHAIFRKAEELLG